MTSLRPVMKEQAWPADGLEHVPNCPVCASGEHSILHDQLWDNVFFTAPGKWTLWQCQICRSAYLAPRPTPETIGRAYERYYTHDDVESEPPPSRNKLERLCAALGNGYRNHRYGTAFEPTSPVGPLLGAMLPPLRWAADAKFRYLPRRRRDEKRPPRLLDIGCGSGSFLKLARPLGWQVGGAEPDPKARAQAKKDGIEVRETAESWLDEAESFDFVTISHVIEHVHDPLNLLRQIRRLLRATGQLYVETPNIDSLGHQIYGRYWRGLEPPRHLVLFNRNSLKDALQRTGFRRIRFHGNPNDFVFTSQQSRRIAAGLDPYGDDGSAVMREPRFPERFRAGLPGGKSEFLIVTATKA